MSQPQLYVSSGKYAIFPDRKIVVNEMQVLLTTHESTNFSNLLFLLIQIPHGGRRTHIFS